MPVYCDNKIIACIWSCLSIALIKCFFGVFFSELIAYCSDTTVPVTSNHTNGYLSIMRIQYLPVFTDVKTVACL